MKVGRAPMKWLRTMPGFVRVLVALFMLAQFAGVVSSPLASAEPAANAGAAPEHSGHDHAVGHAGHHHDGGEPSHQHRSDAAALADACCALHAYFVGMMPPAIAIETASVIGEPLALATDNRAPSVPPDRLDRPPRPQR